MADEIAQVVEMEYKGVYYLFKGTKAMVAAFASAITAISDWSEERKMSKPGNRSWEDLQKISNGTPPILEFPKEMFEEKIIKTNEDGSVIKKSDFDLYCEKHNLRYCIMPDLNSNDDYIPVGVPAQDVGIHQEQIKAVMNRRIQVQEAKDEEYEKKIAAVKERLANASTDKESAEKELAALLDGKEQNKELLDESKEKLEHDNVLDFAEYLKQGEDSLFETDPHKALKEESMCGIVREYTPYECMWPVRDEGLVPDSKEIIYSQKGSDDEVHMIRRKFLTDDQGKIYSEYRIRMPETSEVKVYSDQGLTKEQWQKQIPAMLKDSGMMNETPTAVVQSEARFRKYMEFLDENFKDAQAAKKETITYSSDEAELYVEGANRKVTLRKEYGDSKYVSVAVPVGKIMPDGEEIMCLELSEGLVKGIVVESMDDKTANVFIESDATYKVSTPDGKMTELKGSDVIDRVTESAKEAFSRAILRGGR